MPTSYPGSTPTPWKRTDGFPNDANPVLDDVPRQFGRLHHRPEYLGARDSRLIPGRKYTETNFGTNESRSHFQGLQRLGPPNGRFFVLSGGDAADRFAQLFVVELATRPERGVCGTNLRFATTPAADDRLRKIYLLDETLWHAGGISACGDILAVPLEDDVTRQSRVVFLDATDPMRLLRFPATCEISRPPAVGAGGAASLTRLANGHYLCGVWTAQHLDLYLSRTPDFLGGFDPDGFCRWEWARVLPPGGRTPSYQNVNFVTQRDGALYLVGTENTGLLAPLDDGHDRTDLLRVDLAPETARTSDPILTVPAVTRVSERDLGRQQDYGNMAGAAGVCLAPQWRGDALEPEGQLLLYTGYHWRVHREIRFVELHQCQARDAPPITDVEQGWVELYEHPDFAGRRLSVFADRDAEIRNYKRINVQGGGFGDTVSSVRFQLPVGRTYRLFRDDAFKPHAASVALEGDGRVHEIPDLGALDFDDAVSSSRFDP